MAALLWMHFRRDPWQTFAAAVARSPHRLARGRFAVLDARRPLLVTRGASVAIPTPSSSVSIAAAAAKVLESSSDEHHRAIATFYLGHGADARRSLQDLAARRPSAAVWNDLAVVLAEDDRNDETLIAALAAVGHALDLEPANLPARFNRAAIIERLGLPSCAARAWNEYLRADEASSSWAVEAGERLAALRSKRAGAWEDEYLRLRAAAGDGDTAVIQRFTAEHPQEARLAVLNQVLPRWGEAVLRGNDDEAAPLLTLARFVGGALRETTGDAMTSEIVAAVQAAGGDARRRALAEAHVRYGEAAADNTARRIAPAAAKFASVQALFERLASPAALMSAYYRATTAVDRGDRPAALRTLTDLSTRTPPSYRALQAQMHRLRGTIFFFDGFFAEALASYQRARDEFIAIGETENAIDTTSRLTGTLAALGRPAEAWPIDRAAIKAAGDSGAPRVMQVALHSASFVALEEKRWDMACALLDVEIGIAGANPRVRAESIVWRVLAAQRAGFQRDTGSRMDEARRGVATVTDPDWRESALNDLRLLEAMFIKENAPQRALDLLTEYIASARSRGRMSRVPEILSERAAVLRRLQRDDEAEADLRAAIRLVEERGNRVERDLLRDTFLGKAGTPYTMLADLLDSRGDVAGAIVADDLHRARILNDRRGSDRSLTWSVDAVTASLEPATALVVYEIFDDRVVLFVLRRNGVYRVESRISAAFLAQLTAQFVESIRDDSPGARRVGRSLYDALIGPAADALAGAGKLVMVADAPLDQIPFAALVQRDGKFLIEQFTLSIAPSIRSYHPAPSGIAERAAVLSIGNPRVDETRYPLLPPIEEAEPEARKIASMYPKGTLLTGAEATEARVKSLLAQADVIHFGTHAIAEATNADSSRLLLAPSAQADGALTAAEVAAIDLRRVDTVVLAGCRTAAPSRRGYGFVQSIATAFLAAGAQHVIGSLWDIEDQAGRTLSTALHRRIRSGLPLDRTVRETQLEMIHSYPISDWAALQLYATN
jgi:CHAT domain-containing protein/tetratricopeptide (TPR) repeat protein